MALLVLVGVYAVSRARTCFGSSMRLQQHGTPRVFLDFSTIIYTSPSLDLSSAPFQDAYDSPNNRCVYGGGLVKCYTSRTNEHKGKTSENRSEKEESQIV